MSHRTYSVNGRVGGNRNKIRLARAANGKTSCEDARGVVPCLQFQRGEAADSRRMAWWQTSSSVHDAWRGKSRRSRLQAKQAAPGMGPALAWNGGQPCSCLRLSLSSEGGAGGRRNGRLQNSFTKAGPRPPKAAGNVARFLVPRTLSQIKHLAPRHTGHPSGGTVRKAWLRQLAQSSPLGLQSVLPV